MTTIAEMSAGRRVASPVVLSAPRKRGGELPQLDVMRGTACVMMVANHAAHSWMEADWAFHPAVRVAEFVGCFAPVVFFFVSAIGIGLRGGPAADGRRVLYKAAVLVAVEVLLRGEAGRWVGLDFLGFIALLMIVLEGLARFRHRVAIAVVGIFVLLGLRFGAGPFVLHHLPAGTGRTVLGRLLGAMDTPGVSYNPCPWLIYPLAGFVIGTLLHGRRNWLTENRRLFYVCGTVAAVMAGACSAAMVAHGWMMMRWMIVSIAFVVASASCLSAVMVLATAACAAPALNPFTRWLSLRGISSLAVVPVHYLLIAVALAAMPWVGGHYFVGLAVLVPVVFAISRRVDWLANRAAAVDARYQPWVGGVAVAVVAGALLVLVFADGRNEWERMSVSIAGQLVLCVLLLATPWSRGGGAPRARGG